MLVLIVAVMVLSGGWLSPLAKRQALRALRKQYQGDIEIQSLHVSLFPHPKASGGVLTFQGGQGAGMPPLIALHRFEAETGWFALLRSPHRIHRVRLDGLRIRIAHGGHAGARQDNRRTGQAPKPSFMIEEIVADGTVLEVIPKAAGKQPLTFDIYKLTLSSVGPNRPMRYRAELRNAKPPGLIHATGEFGPWHFGDAGRTPVTGKYQFSNADLGVFKGISGRLSSTGEFHGPLDRLEVNGTTDTPGFTVSAGGRPMDLKTTFRATVDGTNGDTLLHPVNARFGSTTVLAQGGVTGTPGVPGKTVSLEASVQDGDLADVLRLGVKSNPPPMTGSISFHSKIEIPPGDRDVADKLHLDGRFDILSGKFTSPVIEKKVSSLSEHARGNPESAGESQPVSNLRGRFLLDNGVMRLAGLTFHVPGATIRLNGTYSLVTEQLDFHGTATMEARLSEMTTGIKSFLLKALDPIFHKNHAGTVIPIHISGTREKPSVGLDFKR